VVPTEERRQALLTRIAEAHERLLAEVVPAHRELAALDEEAPAARIHPGIRQGHGMFSVAQDGAVTDDAVYPGRMLGF
jgi:hypothetical protein